MKFSYWGTRWVDHFCSSSRSDMRPTPLKELIPDCHRRRYCHRRCWGGHNDKWKRRKGDRYRLQINWFLQVAVNDWNLTLLDPTLILPRLIVRSQCQKSFLHTCMYHNKSVPHGKQLIDLKFVVSEKRRECDFEMGLTWYMTWLSQLSSLILRLSHFCWEGQLMLVKF